GQIVSVAFLFSVLTLPLRAIGWVLVDLPRTTVGAARVQRVLRSQAELSYGRRTLPADRRGPATLRMRSASYTYPPYADDDLRSASQEPAALNGAVTYPERFETSTTALRDVSLDLPTGKTVALVGPTGSGKSTLTMLAARLLDPDTGVVEVNGVDARDLAEGEIPRSVALVGQSTFLFDDTVRDNVTLGEPFDDRAVWAALSASHLSDVVAQLPNGLDTQIGERGVSLSGGQRQRLALARALIRRPQLLILDDATSSVDPRIEQRVLRGIRDTVRPRDGAVASTVLLVAYRRASVALADQVVFLSDGRVVAQGTHEELMLTVPGYVDLITAYDEPLDADTPQPVTAVAP
ncbi:MAG: ABC transporter ATP-binding protein, partial [Mycobacteriales bacterium]